MAQAKKMLSKLKRFQEGGEVQDEFPEEAGVMPGQNPSEAAKQMLFYKKTAAPRVVPDTGQADGMYQPPSVTSETERIFGMKPREDRLTILPRYSRETGWVAPEMLYDAARAIAAPGAAVRGADVGVPDAVNMAFNVAGGGFGASAAMRRPTGEGGIDLAMNAYHGSPYVIADKFDLTRAGTGTGAQQYGHGVYFAEARPTAERFMKGAKQKGFDFKTEEEALGIELPTNARSHFMLLAQEMPGNPALDPVKASELILSKNPDARNIAKEKLANLFQTYQEKTQGNLYQVDIPDAQVAKMLDWNKPLSQQSPEVLEIIKKIPAIQTELRLGKTLDDLKGGNAYQAIASGFDVRQNEAYKLASDFLNQQGIPGIRYDDYYAKDASNFVVFDPDMVQMLMRNDKPVSTLPSSTTAKEDLAKMPGVLPKAERDANLNKMLEGSKAVDKDGNPIRLYHGTNQDINEFSTQPGALRKKFYAGELGSWFGDDPEIANQFAKGVSFKKEKGSVYPVFLNIKNPKVFDSYDDFMSVMKNRKSAPAVRKELIKQGYDGIQVKDSTTDFGGKRDDWVAFFPEQVKSAIGNRGTYDPTNPDITMAKGGEVRKPK
jgi:hypothetical protein